ncbi:MAG: homoserine kinase [Oscillospiraceae bacterium]|nr:homoserine kinase [Oscillospiraceae bacterium]
MIKIDVPATSANLGSGFDSLGIALSLYNTILMEESDCVDIASLDSVKVPLDEENLVYSTAKRLYDICGKQFLGLKLRQSNAIPMARGLGSSSACLVSGLIGANTLLKSPLNKEDIINLAAALEGHPDNTTPALLGGLVTCAMSEGKVYSVSVPVDSHVRFAAMIPSDPLPTSHARSVLPQSVSRDDAVFNLSRAALMTSSLFSGSLENLKVATDDRLHQPYRMGLIKGSASAFRVARDLGAYGVYISGAGSTVMAIIDESNTAFELDCATQLKKSGIFDWTVQILHADSVGATVTELI